MYRLIRAETVCPNSLGSTAVNENAETIKPKLRQVQIKNKTKVKRSSQLAPGKSCKVWLCLKPKVQIGPQFS